MGTGTKGIVGIDVSKDKLDVSTKDAAGKRRRKSARNTPGGRADLIAWLESNGLAGATCCHESTGRYGDALADELHAAGFEVRVANPGRVKRFADAMGSRNKTDASDADVILEFAALMPPPVWTPPRAEIRSLRALLLVRDGLVGDRAEWANRAKAELPGDEASLARLQIARLDREVDDLDATISMAIGSDPELSGKRDLLSSIPGVGAVLAAVFLSLVPEGGFARAKELVAFAGLNPRRVESGTMRGTTRISKVGHGRLREALYMAAMSGMACNPILAAFAARLKAREGGMAGKAVVVALSRKLLTICHGVLRSKRPFEVPAAAPAPAS